MPVLQKSLKILVVDDEQQIFDVIKEHLEIYKSENPQLATRDLRILHAPDGPNALNKIQNESFHLLIIDNQLPKIEGLKLIDLLKKTDRTKKIPIIFISGMLQGPEIKEAVALGVKHILAKPFEGDKLINTIKTALESSAAL